MPKNCRGVIPIGIKWVQQIARYRATVFSKMTESFGMTPDELAEICATCEYNHPTEKGDAGIAVIYRFAFTWAILSGVNRWGYEDRWCYSSYEKCKAAFDAWDGTGEPTGWHRHPKSGRRVAEDGTEYVMF